MSNEKYNVEAVLKAVDYFGSVTAFARSIGVTRNTIYRWIRSDFAPSRYNCIIIEKATKGKIKAKHIIDIDWK